MNFRFHEAADEEAIAITAYYEQQRPGLGQEFAVEIEAAIRRILSFPDAWPPYDEGTRICRTKRFPYGIVYERDEKMITILAVMHLRRDPGYWKGRT